MIKLLLPVDGSDCSLRAVQHIIALAKRCPGIAIRLLYVYDLPVRLGDVGIAVTDAQMKEAERRRADPLLATAERTLHEAGVPYEREVRAGDPPLAIAMRAEELGCDGIVMGTHGAGALTNLTFGSVAMKVVHLSKVPVTLVK